jgi:putative transposase
MPRKRFRPEEIIAKLREADVLLGQGKRVAEVVKALGVSEVTYYRWRQEYGGMSVSRTRGKSPGRGELTRLCRAGADPTCSGHVGAGEDHPFRPAAR